MTNLRCTNCGRINSFLPDNLCSQCYYTVNGRILRDYMTEGEILEIIEDDKWGWLNPSTKACRKCMVEYPRNKGFFYANGNGYLRPICKSCLKVTA